MAKHLGWTLTRGARTESAAWKLNIDYEFTARDTPQQNHLAEIAISNMNNHGRALMYRAHVPEHHKRKLFREAWLTAVKLDGLDVVTIDNESRTRYEHLFGSNPAFAQHLRTWGEAGTVKLKTDTTPKMHTKGVACVFVGYTNDHAGDCYRMWNPISNMIHETRDVLWLNRMYFKRPTPHPEMLMDPLAPIEAGERANTPPPTTATENVTEETEEEDVVEEEEEVPEEDFLPNKFGGLEEEEEASMAPSEASEGDEIQVRTSSGRTVKPNKRYIETAEFATSDERLELVRQPFGLTDAEVRFYDMIMNLQQTKDAELACVGAGLGGGFQNTKELHVLKYDEAMKTEDKPKWEEAVKAEHDKMVKFKVWKAVYLKDLPQHAKVLTTTWAMKKKASGVHRARVNARGFEQVDGIHFDKDSIASPVVNDMTIRIVLTIMLMANWFAYMIDHVGAFLHRAFEPGETLYIKVPKGMERFYPEGTVLELLRTLYGLKQSAAQYWKETIQCFEDMGYSCSKADPCLYFKWTVVGLMIWMSWVDDLLSVGKKGKVLEEKEEMKKRFDCDDVGEANEYVGCKVD